MTRDTLRSLVSVLSIFLQAWRESMLEFSLDYMRTNLDAELYSNFQITKFGVKFKARGWPAQARPKD